MKNEPSNSPKIDRRKLLFAGGAIVLLSAADRNLQRRDKLRDPFEWLSGKPRDVAGDLFHCPPTPPPVASLSGIKFYVDQKNTKVGAREFAADAKASLPITSFTSAVQSAAEAWVSSNGTHPQAALCGLGHLKQWAIAGAMQGDFNEQARATRRFNLAGISIAFLALRHAQAATSTDLAKISDWLEKTATICRGDEHRLMNNHLHWLAAGVTASAIASQNGNLFDAGLAMVRRGLSTIRADGSLPLEIVRGERALIYHSFTLGPMLLVAELARANGIDIYQEHGGALDRLTHFVIRNIQNPAEVTRLAGTPQTWTSATQNTVPWIELAGRRYQDPWLTETLRRLRPVRYPFLGGNQTLLFAVKFS